MGKFVHDLNTTDRSQLEMAGGKGANLGELMHIPGIQVPEGFYVTTEAYRQVLATDAELQELVKTLADASISDKELINGISQKIRMRFAQVELPEVVETEIRATAQQYAPGQAFAVRSSATAEDLPHASFAGQQASYLNVIGKEELLQAVKQCWASLFTDRAVNYRLENGFDHQKVALAVIVQEMVPAEAAGVMFTADPMTSDRMTLAIEAGFGLGEAVVSGAVTPDRYSVQNETIVEKTIAAKKKQILPKKLTGTMEVEIPEERRRMPVLTDTQVLELAQIGKTIERHFGAPQDIEWGLADGTFYIVQSRALTTLFPVPQFPGRKRPRVFMSIGHTQMMTAAMKPLGVSFFKFISAIKLDEVGSRVFADITHDLTSWVGRRRLVRATAKQDPLMHRALQQLLGDPAFTKQLPSGERNVQGGVFTTALIKEAFTIMRKNDPSIIDEALQAIDEKLNRVEKRLVTLSGEDVFAYIQNDREQLQKMGYDTQMLGAIIATIIVTDSINKQAKKWLGEGNVTDTLSKSVPHNVTTEMGLALCDLSDVLRQYPEVTEYLSQHPDDETFFTEMRKLPGGPECEAAFQQFFRTYGMRGPGEIDLTRDRWEEKPTQLIPLLLNNIRVLEPGEHWRKFEEGRQEAEEKAANLLQRIRALPGGKRKAKKMEKNIRLLRNFNGCREYPKYFIIRRFYLYKQAVMKEADRLVESGVLKQKEDVFYLYLDELQEVVRTHQVDYARIDERKAAFKRNEKLTSPRIITSSGHVPSTKPLEEDIPNQALSGVPVYSGTVEGRARVVLSIEDAEVEAGDILVTRFTDPSWTPLFATVHGLVTEIGGFTTHGAIVAREYGLPGVVGVENATQKIQDGQRIRVNGTKGYVEIMEQTD